MAKQEETINMEGVVEEIMPAAMFRIKLDDLNNVVIGYLSGRMRTNNIKVLLGDRVEIVFSPYDLTRGRITRRK
jgi:translation initiation factor IF-1